MNMNLNYINVTASTIQKKKRYYAVLYYKNFDGTICRKTKTTGLSVKSSKKELKNKIEEIRFSYEQQVNSLVEANTIITQASQTPALQSEIYFVDFMKDWLLHIKPQIELTTYSGYSKIVNKICSYFSPSKLKLAELKPIHIQNFYNYLTNQNLKNSTIMRYHANIQKALDYALKLELVTKNVAKLVDKPSERQTFHCQVYNIHELKLLFKIISNSEYKLPIMLAAYYGLRREEIIGLKWRNIDFEKKTITICHTVVPATIDHKRILVKKDRTKNDSSYRTLPLIPQIEDLLYTELKYQEKNKNFFGNTWENNEGYVCVRKNGKLIHPETLSRNFKKILINNNLKVIRLHDLRHTSATIFLNNGNLDIKRIQNWLGHSSYNTTANIYTHLDKSANVVTGDVVSNLLKL